MLFIPKEEKNNFDEFVCLKTNPGYLVNKVIDTSQRCNNRFNFDLIWTAILIDFKIVNVNNTEAISLDEYEIIDSAALTNSIIEFLSSLVNCKIISIEHFLENSEYIYILNDKYKTSEVILNELLISALNLNTEANIQNMNEKDWFFELSQDDNDTVAHKRKETTPSISSGATLSEDNVADRFETEQDDENDNGTVTPKRKKTSQLTSSSAISYDKTVVGNKGSLFFRSLFFRPLSNTSDLSTRVSSNTTTSSPMVSKNDNDNPTKKNTFLEDNSDLRDIFNTIQDSKKHTILTIIYKYYEIRKLFTREDLLNIFVAKLGEDKKGNINDYLGKHLKQLENKQIILKEKTSYTINLDKIKTLDDFLLSMAPSSAFVNYIKEEDVERLRSFLPKQKDIASYLKDFYNENKKFEFDIGTIFNFIINKVAEKHKIARCYQHQTKPNEKCIALHVACREYQNNLVNILAKNNSIVFVNNTSNLYKLILSNLDTSIPIPRLGGSPSFP